MFKKRWTLFPIILLLLTGCGTLTTIDVGPTVTESETVELGTADSARVDIRMGLGEMDVRGGANELFAGDFTYNIESWQPDISYEMRGREGQLAIAQPETDFEGIPNDDIRYEWDLAFSNDVPLDMNVDLGLGESSLIFSGMQLTDLTVRTGVGSAEIDLSGEWAQSFNVSIEGGVGEVRVILPREVGVRVEPTTGLGSIDVFGLVQEGDVYTNQAYETSDVTIDVRVRGGVGRIRLELAGE